MRLHLLLIRVPDPFEAQWPWVLHILVVRVYQRWKLLRLGNQSSTVRVFAALVAKGDEGVLLDLVRRFHVLGLQYFARRILTVFDVNCESVLPVLLVFVDVDVVLANFLGIVELLLEDLFFEVGDRLWQRYTTIRKLDARSLTDTVIDLAVNLCRRVVAHLVLVEHIHEFVVKRLPHYVVFAPQEVKSLLTLRRWVWNDWVLRRARWLLVALIVLLTILEFLSRRDGLTVLNTVAILKKNLYEDLKTLDLDLVLTLVKIGLHFINFVLQFPYFLLKLVNNVLANRSRIRLAPFIPVVVAPGTPPVLSALASLSALADVSALVG